MNLHELSFSTTNQSIVLLLAAALAGLSSPASADVPKLHSREYKLMLESDRFASSPDSIVDRFWDQVLKPLIEKNLDRRKDGGPRHKEKFAVRPERAVMFRDTASCVLWDNGYVLRERVRLKDGRRELTLKLRTPDIFLAAQSQVAAIDEKAEIKTEEDIAPMIERTVAGGQENARFSRPPTFRSLFSRSVTQRVGPEGRRVVAGRHRIVPQP